MNNKPTYLQQSEKIIQAYLKEEINPYYDCACFVGNLLNNNGDWSLVRSLHGLCASPGVEVFINPYIPDRAHGACIIEDESDGLYNSSDIIKLESNFLKICSQDNYWDKEKGCTVVNEDCLFEAMTSTLELLKEIHIEKGEITEEEPVFERRVLKTSV